MFKKHFLFPSTLYTHRIEPNLYPKQDIIKTVTENYNKNNVRNSWDETSTLHHYYEDWANPNFKQVNLSDLVPLYNNIFKNFIDGLNLVKPVNYNFRIENLTVHKDNTEQMIPHIHHDSFFAAVHYISVDSSSSPIVFNNPLPFVNYMPRNDLEVVYDAFIYNNEEASTYFRNFKYSPIEDEIIIFPSYLFHGVEPSRQINYNNKLRIAIACNICLSKEVIN